MGPFVSIEYYSLSKPLHGFVLRLLVLATWLVGRLLPLLHSLCDCSSFVYSLTGDFIADAAIVHLLRGFAIDAVVKVVRSLGDGNTNLSYYLQAFGDCQKVLRRLRLHMSAFPCLVIVKLQFIVAALPLANLLTGCREVLAGRCHFLCL